MLVSRTVVLSLLLSVFAAGCGRPSTGEEKGGGASGGDGSEGGASGRDPNVSPGCQASDAQLYPPGTTQGSLDVSGASTSVERSFRVHLPPDYNAMSPTPVVLMFHGGGGSARQFQNQSAKMDVIADREGFITVYPQGTGGLATWNGGNCCGRAAQDNVDDVSFVDALLDHLEVELCVDRRRVFATGMSNGAIFSHRLACELSTRVAAIAPVAGTWGVEECTPTRSVPVMQIHGTDDGHVPWDGGVGCGPSATSFTSVPTSMDHWREQNGCEANSTTVFSQGNGRCLAYSGCETPVELCTIDGGGHSWPGGEPSAEVVDCPENGPQSDSFMASEAIWRFFAENPLP